MTTPQYPWSTTNPDDLPQGVVAPGQLGNALQNPSAAKFRNLAAGRFPGQVDDDLAGNPANVNGPLGTVVNQFAAFTEDVATADPADIQGPEDLRARVNGFFGLRPVLQALIFTPLSYLLAWIVDGDPDDYDTLEEIQDNLIPALIRLPLRILAQLIGGIPIVGDAVEDALAGWLKDTNETAVDAAETAVSVGTQVNYMQHLIAVRTGRPLWETGPDRTACVSFPFGLMNLSMATISIGGGSHQHDITGNTGTATAAGDLHSHPPGSTQRAASNSGGIDSAHTHTVILSTEPPSVKATATYAPWGTVIFDSAAERKVVNWIAWKSGTVSTFHIDIYKLEADGTSTFTGYTTPDLAGALATMPAWMSHLMSGISIVADIDDVFEAQFRMTGTGDVHIAGVNMPNPIPLPGFRPYTAGSGRNPSTTPTPSTLSLATRDAMYTGPTPFIGFGIDVGQVDLPRYFFDDFNRSSLGARWIRFGDIGISDNKVQFTGSSIANTTAAAMYHQPLATDFVEVGFDATIDEEDVGVGVHCPSNLSNGVWVTADVGGVRIQTGAYGSRTDRATATVPGSGRYTVRVIPSLDETHYVYQVFFGDPNAEGATPVVSWPDTTNSVPAGIGRRWWAVMARRNGLIYPSGRLDNVTAADITITEEP